MRQRQAGYALLLAVLLLRCASGNAADIRFDTSSGRLFVDGSVATALRGTTVDFSAIGGVGQFRFLGDLEFTGNDTITATGDRPLSIYGGNDIRIADGAFFDLDASGVGGQLGGGDGAFGEAGGAGGLGAGGGFAGIGGLGGRGAEAADLISFCIPTQNSTDGSNGIDSSIGFSGDPGRAGVTGQPGDAGFNNPNSGGTAGAGGAPGIGGNGGDPGRIGGNGGARGVNSFSQDTADANDGSAGRNGFAGFVGGLGWAGGSATGGTNIQTGWMLTAGGGGGSGGSGGGGGGGGSGSGGSGGGGGGGGGLLDPGVGGCGLGADGGDGGDGGAGGSGGNGGTGGSGAPGGAGGGAIEIRARGRLIHDGAISVRGAGSGTAFAPENGDPGQNGGIGGGGFGPNPSISDGGNGGRGGAGGRGGNGTRGGRGGFGGPGGGGAGGTVRLQATLYDGDDGLVNTLPGNAATNGRFLVGHNGDEPSDNSTFGSRIGTAFERFDRHGGGGVNPFVEGGVTETFNVVDLEGGADVAGVKERLLATDRFFENLVDNAPSEALAAVVRLGEGPSGDVYDGQDTLLFVNLTDDPLRDPMLGVTDQRGSTFVSPLAMRGFANHPDFGGRGPTPLRQIEALSVYATLIPDVPYVVNFAAEGHNAAVELQVAGDFGFLVETAPILEADYNGDGVVDAADYTVWRDGLSGDSSEAGYDLWVTNFGTGTPTTTSSSSNSVPEPGTCTSLIAACLSGALWRYRGKMRSRSS